MSRWAGMINASITTYSAIVCLCARPHIETTGWAIFYFFDAALLMVIAARFKPQELGPIPRCMYVGTSVGLFFGALFAASVIHT